MPSVCGVIGFLLLNCAWSRYGVVSKYQNELAEAAHLVKAVQGGVAKLPCDITPSFPGDKAYIIIWYKEDQNGKFSPIYTFDSRDNILLGQGKHWSAELGLGDRAYFRFQEEPAKLTIDNVLHSDAGVYQCRVDFKQSPTRNSKVNLTVIIPPRKLSILDEKGIQVANYVLGPYNEGSSINLTCVATGGFPAPKVTWWQENALLDDSCEDLSENRVKNILHMERLQRKHLRTVLTCQASNNDLIAPISTSMRLDLNLRPLSIKILGENKPLSVGKLYPLKCEVIGSSPAPKISWWRGNTRMSDTRELRSEDGNVTTSILTFTPSLEDEGKYITCNAKQPLIPDSTLETGWKLSILHVPVVSLEVGNKASNKIKEGSDVYFECNIKSNPWVYKISWRHNDKMLFSNVTEGIIISNQSLVLQEVNRNRAGFYSCVGSNQEGDGESNSVQLEIQYLPVCRSKQVVTYRWNLYETFVIGCDLDANPTSTEIVWFRNNTEGHYNSIPVGETTGTLSYTPQTERDYGTLLCKGINAIGEQQEPCVFHIIRSDKPDPLPNCSLLNQTHHGSLIIECAHRLDEGLNQIFVAEVYNLHTQSLLKNLTSQRPAFTIDGLTAGLPVEINLYVITEKGRSETTRLNARIPSWENPAEVLLPPENCSVTSQTRFHLRIKCQAPKIQSRKSLTYLLQVYDANSRTLVGTATSQSPEAITVTALPRDYQDLLLFVRGVDENSVTSNATVLNVRGFARTASLTHRASAPVKFHITPTLAVTISAVAALVLIFVVLLAVNRLCKRGGHDDKDYDDGRPYMLRPECTVIQDKNETPGKSTDTEEDKNPDVIPADEVSVFDHLNALSSKTYLKLQDADDISTGYIGHPEILSLKQPPRYSHIKPPERGLSNTEPMLLSNPRFFPVSSEHYPLYKPDKFRYIPKTLPEGIRLHSEGGSSVLQPLLRNRDRIPMMLLPHQQLTATEL